MPASHSAFHGAVLRSPYGCRHLPTSWVPMFRPRHVLDLSPATSPDHFCRYRHIYNVRPGTVNPWKTSACRLVHFRPLTIAMICSYRRRWRCLCENRYPHRQRCRRPGGHANWRRCSGLSLLLTTHQVASALSARPWWFGHYCSP